MNTPVEVEKRMMADVADEKSTPVALRTTPWEWLTIDSAPKDKTPILGANFRRYSHGEPTRIWWQPEFSGWISAARVMTLADGYQWEDGSREQMHSPTRFEPTHWTPLPPLSVRLADEGLAPGTPQKGPSNV